MSTSSDFEMREKPVFQYENYRGFESILKILKQTWCLVTIFVPSMKALADTFTLPLILGSFMFMSLFYAHTLHQIKFTYV